MVLILFIFVKCFSIWFFDIRGCLILIVFLVVRWFFIVYFYCKFSYEICVSLIMYFDVKLFRRSNKNKGIDVKLWV